uniref:AT13029p n=1 Tax=Drosophila melanogaster TaxID=7227 RepID=B5RID9_DROME|nr:AT13029p [Drosophila melanogaster]
MSSYICQHFKSVSWIRLPVMCSDLNCVGVTIQLPLSVLCDNLTLRCVRTFFDPLSHLAKSFELVIDSSVIPNCGLVDIADSVMSEWMTQMDIQEDLVVKMETEMRAYNEAIAFIAQAEAKEKRKSQKKKIAIPKPPKMPQELPAGMFPDPRKIFLEHEKRDCTDFFNRYFHPGNINLLPSEVNLRRFIILGGIVSLVFVGKAKHASYEKFNITLHEDGRVLRKSLNILDESSTEECSMQPSKLDIGTDIMRDTEVGEASKIPLHLEPDELPYYFLTFKVPNHLCLWGEPIVCQFFESEIEETPSKAKAEELDKKLDKKKKPVRKSSRKENESVLRVPTTSGSVSMSEEKPPQSNRPTYHQPARENSVNIYRPSALTIVRQSGMETEQIQYKKTFKNSNLVKEPISKRNLSLLQDQCLPRIISSLRFPRDFQDDKMEAQAMKKIPVTQLYKRQLTESVGSTQIEKFSFNYEDQSNPERLYPKFPVTEDLRVETDRTDSSKEEGTMLGLLRTLEGIKDKYLDAPKRIVEQTTHAVRMSRKAYSDPIPTTRSRRQSYFGRRSVRQLDSSIMSIARPVDIEYELSETSDTGEQMIKSRKDSRLPSTILSQSAEPRNAAHWTTEFILESSFNKESKVVIVKTDRLGHFGFAYRRYAHFPFRHWELEKNEQNHDEIILTLDTYHVRVVFFISKDGIRCHAIDIPKEYVHRPFKYIDIDKPISTHVSTSIRAISRRSTWQLSCTSTMPSPCTVS